MTVYFCSFLTRKLFPFTCKFLPPLIPPYPSFSFAFSFHQVCLLFLHFPCHSLINFLSFSSSNGHNIPFSQTKFTVANSSTSFYSFIHTHTPVLLVAISNQPPPLCMHAFIALTISENALPLPQIVAAVHGIFRKTCANAILPSLNSLYHVLLRYGCWSKKSE